MKGVVPLLASLLLAALVLGGCGSDEPKATAPSTSTTAPAADVTDAPDPCAVADVATVGAVLGTPPGEPKRSSEMSGDGAGLVLSCIYPGEGSEAVAYIQRLDSGRENFEASRAATPDAVAVEGGYWVPSKTQLLVLDGDDLVALIFRDVPIELEQATEMMDAALAKRAEGS